MRHGLPALSEAGEKMLWRRKIDAIHGGGAATNEKNNAKSENRAAAHELRAQGKRERLGWTMQIKVRRALMHAGANCFYLCALALLILAGAMVGSLARGLWFLIPWLCLEISMLSLAAVCAWIAECFERVSVGKRPRAFERRRQR